jgi:aminoglycoside phosphotransferase (APT) family kinase protein
MQLTNDNLYYYLNQKGLINSETVVNGDYMVQSFNTRTSIKKVSLKEGQSLFIKQASNDAISTGILKREADAYNFLKQNKAFVTLSESVPSLLHYDDTEHILVTELIPHSVSLHEYYLKNRNFSESLAIDQARLLAACHFSDIRAIVPEAFPKQIPWILKLNEQESSKFFPDKLESTKLIASITENKFLKEELRKLKSEWVQTHFIHGDIKWINFLVIQNKDELKLKLIDWELADLGDPAWDVAGLVQSYIAAWVFGFDNAKPEVFQLSEAFQTFNITSMQPSIQKFLMTYLNLRKIEKSEWLHFMLKTMRYTAARIIQTSIEGVVYTPQIFANNMRCIQLAYNILNNPTQAIQGLLGINYKQYE